MKENELRIGNLVTDEFYELIVFDSASKNNCYK